jgi:glycosyltransferase involved in cell wall biosynthesis
MILVDSIYTNHSGAKRLLEYFISYAYRTSQINDYFFLIDGRLESKFVSLIPSQNYLVLRPGERGRLGYYKNLPSQISAVFCFNSVPPPVEVSTIPVVILQHNSLFFENPGYGIAQKTYYMVKKLYIKAKTRRNYFWIVQTERIRDIIIKSLPVYGEMIAILPFFELKFKKCASPISASQSSFSFLYVADGVPQKNHDYLFRVWEMLRDKYGLLPELHLTIPLNFDSHIQRIEKLRKGGLKIVNHGFLPSSAMENIYSSNKYLLFPSLTESLGLPLVEAANAGLKIIGADAAYIYQVVNPSAVFDLKRIDSLCDIIVSVNSGQELKDTQVLIEDKIDELFKFIKSPHFV